MQPTLQSVTDFESREPQVFPILRNQLALCWPLIERYLKEKKGGVHDIYSLNELQAELISNPFYHLWVCWDNGEVEGIVVSQFISTSKTSICWVQNVHCDKIRKYLKLWPKFEDWAALLGAKEILFTGSKAWARLLRPYGYKVPASLLQKTINVRWRH